jgi:hypothetical protein
MDIVLLGVLWNDNVFPAAHGYITSTDIWRSLIMRKAALIAVIILAGAGIISCGSATVDTVSDSNLSEFSRYLLQLEASVKLEAQTSVWAQRRSLWTAAVRNAGSNISELRKLLVEFESHVLGSAQSPGWFSGYKRNTWVRNVRAAGSISRLAGLMLEVEESIKFTSQFPTWRSSRAGWIENVRRLQDNTAAQQAAAAVPSAFNQLLIELETSVLFEFQTPQWRSRRPGWLGDVQRANDSAHLRELLLEFEREIQGNAQSQAWLSSQRMGWITRVRSAGSITELAPLMREVETSINYSAQVDTWRQVRNAWLIRVRELEREFY